MPVVILKQSAYFDKERSLNMLTVSPISLKVLKQFYVLMSVLFLLFYFYYVYHLFMQILCLWYVIFFSHEKVDFSSLKKYLNHCNRKASLIGVFHLLLEQSL